MAPYVFNIAKGKVNAYAATAQANTGGAVLKIIPIEASGLEAAATAKDYDTVALFLAGSSNEQTSNWTRKTAATVVVTTDDSGDTQSADFADITWTAATGNAVGALLVAFDPTGSSADTALVPLTLHDFAVTPDGTDVTATVANFFTAS